MREAIIVAFYRGYVCSNDNINHIPGGMAAVGLGREDVLPYLLPDVTIACENSATSVTLSGDEAALEEVMTAINTRHPGALVRRLQVNMAYHSRMISSTSFPL